MIDERGQPVSNAAIWVVGGFRSYGCGISDSEGRFSVAGVPMGLDPARATYRGERPNDAASRECVMVGDDPLVLRALTRDPHMDGR